MTTSTTGQVPLFRPESGERPPADAIDLVAEVPRTVSVFATYLLDVDERDMLAAVQSAHLAALDQALARLASEGGYVKRGEHAAGPRGGRTVGEYVAARIAVSSVMHWQVNDESDWLRPHTHTYLAPYGDCGDAQAWPLDMIGVARALTWALLGYRQTFPSALTDAAATVPDGEPVEWGVLNGEQIILDEGGHLTQYLDQVPQQTVCRGDWPVGYQIALTEGADRRFAPPSRLTGGNATELSNRKTRQF